MLPVIELGSVRIPTYWLMLGIGAVGIFVLMYLRRNRYELSKPRSLLFAFGVLVLGVLGGKLLWILENIQTIRLFGMSLGGLSFFGAVWMVLILTPLLGLLFQIKPLKALDAAAPCGALMIGFMRVGCFFNGCCGGNTVRIGDSVITWPTQAVESIGDFIILYALLAAEKKRASSGTVHAIWLLAYGALRFAVEFFRASEKNAMGFSKAHWYAVTAMLLGGMFLLVRCLTYKKRTGGIVE